MGTRLPSGPVWTLFHTLAKLMNVLNGPVRQTRISGPVFYPSIMIFS